MINDLRNPYFTQFAISAQMAFYGEEYSAVIANTNEDAEIQDKVVAAMIEHDVSAVLISPSYGGDGSLFQDLERAGIPAMQVFRRTADPTGATPFFSLDYQTGGRLAAERLLELGSRRIAFVGGEERRPVTQERMSGYRAVLQERGMTPEAFFGPATRNFGWEAARMLRSERPDIDAAICFNDFVALGMLSAFSQMRVDAGEAFRVVGFDDIDECAQVYPSLSSVRCDSSEVGSQAAELMLRWLVDGVRPPDEIRLPVVLVERQSMLGAEANT